MAKRLKLQYLGLANNQELLQGVQGEIITADVIKPYIDAIATKTNAQDVKTAVDALENKLLNGVDLDGDTLSELYAKITTLQNLEQADKTGLLNAISAKVDKTFLSENYYNENELVNYVSNRISGLDETVQERLDAKADSASIQKALDAKADEISVSTRLDTKITSAQAEAIAQGITNDLEVKIMGGVGTDADTFAELKALLDNMQSLSESDVNGVMTLVSQKVAKTDVYGNDAQSEITPTSADVVLRNFVNDNEVPRNDSKVLSAYLALNLFKNALTLIDAKATTQFVTNAVIEARAEAHNEAVVKLDKTTFDDFMQTFNSLTQRVAELEGMFENV